MAESFTLMQAGQLVTDDFGVVVFRTVGDADGVTAVLKIHRPRDPHIHDVTVRPGQTYDVAGVGQFTLVDAAASTRDQRGWVRLRYDRAAPADRAPADGASQDAAPLAGAPQDAAAHDEASHGTP
ncbi:MAG: hypothetical protein Q4G40_11745 [Brachybacterium sp.]|nr:hypothetical protein [Brachybacterium sp.]